MLRVVFFGTPLFSAHILQRLLQEKVDVAAVVSRPDKPKGRSLKLEPTPIKQFVLENAPHLPLHQPLKASAPEFAALLKEYEADLFVVVAYGEILRDNILSLPRLACINIHTSLLPKWRGAAPIQRAIMAGDLETGVTIMHMVRQLDAGDIILQKKMQIDPEANFGAVESRLCDLSQSALLEALEAFKMNTAQRTPQNESQVTYAKKIEIEECSLSFAKPAQELHDFIRGLSPLPGAWCTLLINGQPKRLKIFQAAVIDSQAPAGTLFQQMPSELCIACGEKALKIEQAQLEGKQRMPVEALMRGLNLQRMAVKV